MTIGLKNNNLVGNYAPVIMRSKQPLIDTVPAVYNLFLHLIPSSSAMDYLLDPYHWHLERTIPSQRKTTWHLLKIILLFGCFMINH